MLFCPLTPKGNSNRISSWLWGEILPLGVRGERGHFCYERYSFMINSWSNGVIPCSTEKTKSASSIRSLGKHAMVLRPIRLKNWFEKNLLEHQQLYYNKVLRVSTWKDLKRKRR